MAAIGVPPRILDKDDKRRQSSSSGKDSLDILKQMGFPENRALKSLAATGDKGVQLASDWLLSHVNDITLDDKVDREYILYLCPVGGLQAELNAFWEKSHNLCGWNTAHAYFPHITLCPFFKVEDRKLRTVVRAFSSLESKLKKLPQKISLEFFSQQNFMALFVGTPQYEYLKKIILEFAADLKKSGIEMEGPKKQFHITCAYQFKPEHYDTLSNMAKDINLQCDARWDFRLYSRDPKIGHCEVRKVLRPYQPKLGDELELVSGDYMVMDPSEVNKSSDGWYNGTSWVSGIHGVFPGSFTKRTAETWTWTLHKSLPLTFVGTNDMETNGEEYDNLWTPSTEPLYAKVNKKHKARKVFVMRHGERVDFAMGRDWTNTAFDEDGKYHQTNLNLPKTVHERPSHLEYIRDSPLTEMGKHQAKLTGSGFSSEKIVISHIFVSPALRCIQTAQSFLEGYGAGNLKLNVEPSLFEWLGWYHPVIPAWIKPEDLSRHGYSINISYTPMLHVKDLNLDETVIECYQRGANFSRFITKKLPPENQNILLVAHAGSLDICTRQLCGYNPRNSSDFHKHLSSIPYCAVCSIQEDPATKRWNMIDSGIKALSHGANKSLNWKSLQTPSH